MLKGSITVIDSSGSWMLKEGDGVIDIMNVWHKGISSEHTELIVFYAGATNIPISVKKGSDSAFAKECF
ncbi:MAG: hypothetical protein HKP13_04900, partial [Gammaproteobacteria bacterium]|nr:hypothetical protein [Gammaproteobacteria bacterium]